MIFSLEVTTGRPYAIEGANGRSFITDQYAVLAHGKAEREFPFIATSDSPFTDVCSPCLNIMCRLLMFPKAEFSRWRQTMVVEDCKIPTKSVLASKVSDINKLINYNFTKEELNEKLRKQGAGNNKMKIWKRLELERELKEAVAEGNDDEVTRIEAELASESAPKLAFGTTLYKPTSEKEGQQQRLAEINLRNQKLNTENVRRAQLEERKMNRKNAVAVARGEAPTDPFARVKTRAKTHHDVTAATKKDGLTEGGNASGTASPAPGTVTPGKSGTPKRSETPSGNPPKSKGIAVIRHRNMDDENIAALDLDIDIDI